MGSHRRVKAGGCLHAEEKVPFHPENVRKLQQKASSYKFTVRTPPRDGRKLLVLDIDV